VSVDAISVTHVLHHHLYITGEEIQMRRSTKVSALVLAGVFASPALLNAQANPTSADERDTAAVTDTAVVTDRDDRNDWGLAGLLGLVGLLGLRRRERADPREQIRTRQTV